MQIVTRLCLFHLTPSHADCKYFVLMQIVNILFSAVKYMQKILADDTFVCV